jgi:hypothetical protein
VSNIQPGVITVAADTVAALKASPMLLVVVMLNLGFLAASTYYLNKQQDHLAVVMDRVFDRCLPGVDSRHQYGKP